MGPCTTAATETTEREIGWCESAGSDDSSSMVAMPSPSPDDLARSRCLCLGQPRVLAGTLGHPLVTQLLLPVANHKVPRIRVVGIESLEAEYVFLYPNQRPRGPRIQLYSSVFSCIHCIPVRCIHAVL